MQRDDAVVTAAVKLYKEMTLEDYYRISESDPTVKYEFFQGVIYAMTGGTPDHSLLGMRIGHLVTQQLGIRSTCQVYNSDLQVGHGFKRLPGHKKRDQHKPFRAYPDVTVVCGERSIIGEGIEQACNNPVILFEVTSPGTEDYDRELKLDEYIRLESLVSYILISHEEKCLTIHTRQEDWKLKEYFKGTVNIPGIKASISIEDLYYGITF